MQMKMFYATLGQQRMLPTLQEQVNEFLCQANIETSDIKMSNSDNYCAICIFYEEGAANRAHWIENEGHPTYCSNCAKPALVDHERSGNGKRYPEYSKTTYCPHCGTKMTLEV